ncbi:MAG: response regulator [Polyangiaceae bacterium]
MSSTHMTQDAAYKPAKFTTDREPARILLVDDHPQNLLALEAILSPFGHDLVKAASGDEALKALLAQEFALILLDVQMPGIDGFETAQLIRSHQRTAHIPIIFITAIQRSPSHIYRGYASGAVDYIVKPFDAEVLSSKVAVFVELYQKTRLIKQQAKQLHDQQVVSLELRYRRLTEALTMPMWAERANGETYYANPAFLEYIGRDLFSARGFATPGLVHPDDMPKVTFETMRSPQLDAFQLEVRLQRADGVFHWHLVRSIREHEGKGRIVIATDIDDRRRSEDALADLVERERSARAEAEEANHAKDAFLATVSHELRTPLNAILGWAQLLMAGQLEPAQRQRAIETIERNAKAQSRLISDLFDVSRIVTGKISLEMRPVDLRTIVKDVVESLQPTVEAKGITIDVRLEKLDSPISGDAARLQQVIWNLLTNSVKFGAKRVDVAVERGASHLSISVTDDGQGIAKDFIPHVFDKFEQADSRSTRMQGGLGLGLSIVRHIVEMHGGSVTAESEGPGKGARFVVRLPTVAPSGVSLVSDRAKSAPNIRTAPAAAASAIDGASILVVDDDDDGRALLAAVLEKCGAEVRTAHSLAEAVAEINRATPHILVSDIGMPGADGYELIRAVRSKESAATQKDGRRIPAIALTAYASTKDRDLALIAGFDDHLSKPVDVVALTATIERLLR